MVHVCVSDRPWFLCAQGRGVPIGVLGHFAPACLPEGGVVRRGCDGVTRCAVLAMCVGALATSAHAQLNESLAGELRFEVFDTASNSWQRTTAVAPASRIEWRVMVSYTGTNTNVNALGSITYQPTFSNIDNTADGGIDQLLPWRNNGTQGITVLNSMLTTAEGASGSPLDTYGRVRFGATTANSSSQNIITTHRHGGDFAAAGAPAGSWLRVSGSFGSSWPLAALPTVADATAANLNAINRGVQANQASHVSPIGFPSTWHVFGTQQLVIFRGALQLSDRADARSLELSSAGGTQQRVGGVNNADDTRFMAWQLGASDNGSWRVGVQTLPATITVIPAPATLTGLAMLSLATARRSRFHNRRTS